MNRLLTRALLACAALASAWAQTYVSAGPIPSQDIVGAANLNKILNLGYPNLELWSQRLLNDCHIVQNVINVLSNNRAITTVSSANVRSKVAAGGFEAVTDPTYVLTFDDSIPAAATRQISSCSIMLWAMPSIRAAPLSSAFRSAPKILSSSRWITL